MITVGDIYNYIDETSPFSSQTEWDNSGLTVGSLDREVKSVVICLDVTKYETELAKNTGSELIISHHPLIFHAIKSVASNSPVYDAVRNDINIISAHTNLDKAPGGVNDCLCGMLGVEYEKMPESVAEGFLNICKAPEFDSAEFARYVSDKLSAKVRYNKTSRIIKKVGVCSGSGADLLTDAARLGCDALLTGDASYHDFLLADEIGLSLFAAGHFETENIIVSRLKEKLSERFPSVIFIESDRISPIETEY